MEGSHATIDAWIISNGHAATILLTNYALPRHPIAVHPVRIILKNSGAPTKATIQRIDQDHANAKRRWQVMGEPEHLNAAALAELHVASRLKDETQACRYQGGALELDITMPPLGSLPLLCNLRRDHA